MSPSSLLAHFKKVSWRDTGCLIPDWDPDIAFNRDSTFDVPFTVEELEHAMSTMRLKAAPGPNGLSPEMVKEIFSKPNAKLYLLRLYNRYNLYIFIFVNRVSALVFISSLLRFMGRTNHMEHKAYCSLQLLLGVSKPRSSRRVGTLRNFSSSTRGRDPLTPAIPTALFP
jgi:hypothetical protein